MSTGAPTNRETTSPVKHNDSTPSVTLQTELVKISELRSKLPDNVVLPTFIPEGYIARNKAYFTPRQDGGLPFSIAEMVWINAGDSSEKVLQQLDETDHGDTPSVSLPASISLISLRVEYPFIPDRPQKLVMNGSAKAVQIGAHSGLLIQGGWGIVNNEKQWIDGPLTLLWVSDDAVYELYTSSASVNFEVLIKIAENLR